MSAKLLEAIQRYYNTVKPVVSSHSKMDKIKVFMTNGRLMQVESIQNAPPEHSAIL